MTPFVSTAAGTSFTVWMPVELVTPIRYGSSATQSNGTTIVVPRRRPIVCWPVERVRDDEVVDRDRCDRQIVLLRVADMNSDLARLELDPRDIEPVGRRRVLTQEVDNRPARRGEHRHDGDQEQDRNERPEAPADRAAFLVGDRSGFHG